MGLQGTSYLSALRASPVVARGLVVVAIGIAVGCGNGTQQAGPDADDLSAPPTGVEPNASVESSPVRDDSSASAVPAQASVGGDSPEKAPPPMAPGFAPGKVTGSRLTDAARPVEVPACSMAPADSAMGWEERDEDAGVATGCGLRYLGDWLRCDGRTAELVEAADARACLQLCKEREDCTSVEELFWAGLPSCMIITSPCDTVWSDVYFEEDAARAYRKECCGWDSDILAPHASPDGVGFVVDATSGCRFEQMGYEMCATYHAPLPGQPVGATLAECLEACQAQEDCATISDPYNGDACILYSEACDTVVRNNVPAHHYRKVCDGP